LEIRHRLRRTLPVGMLRNPKVTRSS
jgi:hypothetical protein